MSEQFSEVLSKFDVVSDDGRQFQIRCPAHEDSSPSMVACISDDGEKLLLHCRAGCKTEEIIDAAGIDYKELFANKDQPSSPRQKAKVSTVYPYTDEEGDVLYEVCRMEPKSFRQRHLVDGSWVWNMKGVRRVLFNLKNIVDNPSWPVVVVEGEKDCLNLMTLGLNLVPTTAPGGAGKWDDDYSVFLSGRRVVIIPDNDDAGCSHAAQVAGSAMVYGAESIRVIHLPVAKGGDLSDWLKENDGAALIEKVQETPQWVKK